MQLAQINIQQQFFQMQPAAQSVFENPASVTNRLLPNIVVVAGLIFFLLILGGGFAMVKGAGGESSPQTAAKARAAITFALVGFLLVVGAYFILQVVITMTGVNFLAPGTI